MFGFVVIAFSKIVKLKCYADMVEQSSGTTKVMANRYNSYHKLCFT